MSLFDSIESFLMIQKTFLQYHPGHFREKKTPLLIHLVMMSMQKRKKKTRCVIDLEKGKELSLVERKNLFSW